MKRVLLAAVLGLAGCSGGRLSPGTEVVAHWGDESRITGERWLNGTNEACWMPAGTRLRVASDPGGSELKVLVLEGEHKDKVLTVARQMITPR